jgi:hypothetical protein
VSVFTVWLLPPAPFTESEMLRCPTAIREFCTVGRSELLPDSLPENRMPGPTWFWASASAPELPLSFSPTANDGSSPTFRAATFSVRSSRPG